MRSRSTSSISCSGSSARSATEFEQKGLVTEVGLKRLREFLSEVPADRFQSPMKSADIPRLFTPETFCKVVVRGQRAAQAAG